MNRLFVLVIAAVVAISMFALPVMAEDQIDCIEFAAMGSKSPATDNLSLTTLDKRVTALEKEIDSYAGKCSKADNEVVAKLYDMRNAYIAISKELKIVKNKALTKEQVRKMLSDGGYLTKKNIINIMSGAPESQIEKDLAPIIAGFLRKSTADLLSDVAAYSKTDPSKKDGEDDKGAKKTVIDPNVESVFQSLTSFVNDNVASLRDLVSGDPKTGLMADGTESINAKVDKHEVALYGVMGKDGKLTGGVVSDLADAKNNITSLDGKIIQVNGTANWGLGIAVITFLLAIAAFWVAMANRNKKPVPVITQ